ncbi:MAG: class I SAM-dependent methyltransferase [Acidobacteria bacterium]|nr:MAG: class I SAM-dependent methyltransferase [Acidobacteriota bacterium]REK04099.1 MAG: class I SAM-dependent methyltransferase [Acidobacteriota bacterium]REK15261.1 MAG: class I SAM-dependent methyltransferase [Acidobacteriota bacterium]REK46351.1 MAG: class I SAM-dependent methyltransferase [Acidobacteriota bacterium]
MDLYDRIGHGYAKRRVSDPTIAAEIRKRLGDARSVLNVGAGTGSYEPNDVEVVAVEPSREMIGQRTDNSNVVRAYAEALPFDDDAFDAVMAVLTIHHWKDQRLGLQECQRVARKRIVLVTWDPASDGFWLTRDYFPEIIERDIEIFCSMELLGEVLGEIDITKLRIPADCRDGFLASYWKRPERYLDSEVRAGISAFSLISDVDSRIDSLRENIESEEWERSNRDITALVSIDAGYRIVTAETP